MMTVEFSRFEYSHLNLAFIDQQPSSTKPHTCFLGIDIVLQNTFLSTHNILIEDAYPDLLLRIDIVLQNTLILQVSTGILIQHTNAYFPLN